MRLLITRPYGLTWNFERTCKCSASTWFLIRVATDAVGVRQIQPVSGGPDLLAGRRDSYHANTIDPSVRRTASI